MVAGAADRPSAASSPAPSASAVSAETPASPARWYRPHVTIGRDAPDIDLSKIEPYRGNIVLGPEQFEEVDDEWRAGVSEE